MQNEQRSDPITTRPFLSLSYSLRRKYRCDDGNETGSRTTIEEANAQRGFERDARTHARRSACWIRRRVSKNAEPPFRNPKGFPPPSFPGNGLDGTTGSFVLLVSFTSRSLNRKGNEGRFKTMERKETKIDRHVQDVSFFAHEATTLGREVRVCRRIVRS